MSAVVSVAMQARGGPIPTARLLPLIESWEDDNPDYGDDLLRRRIYKARFEQEFVSFDFADRLLIDLGMGEAWHHELADLYKVEGRVDTRPPQRKLTPKQGRAIRVLYEAGMSMHELAALTWERHGYANQASGESAIKHMFAANGWPARNPSEANLLRWQEKRCAGCDCKMSARTKGCVTCCARHSKRTRSGNQSIRGSALQKTTCSACAAPLDERTPGCENCASRHHWRRKRGLAATSPTPLDVTPGQHGGATPLSNQTGRRLLTETAARSDERKVAV